MKTLSNRILVEVDMEQKAFHNGLMTAKDYQSNHRDKQPVMCRVIQGNHVIKKGLTLLAHHNFFYADSPFRVVGNTFSISTNENIFCYIDEDGNAHSLFGNIMAERIPISYGNLIMPPEYQKNYPDRVRVVSRGCGYQIGQLIYHLRYADYEIIYNWKGAERRVIKIYKPYIVGSLKPDL